MRNTGLDLVRGACVLLIVAAHTNNILKAYLPGMFRLLYPAGEIAQDLFFALSGFLIGKQILRMTSEKTFGGRELFKFYTNRWIRTIPFYFIFLVINFCLYHFLYRPYGPSFAAFDFDILPYTVFAQNLINRHPPFFPEIWPIPVEEWSYLLLPLPFLFFSGFLASGNVFTKKLLILIALIFTIQGLRMAHIYANHPETDWQLRKIVVFRLDALAYGFILAVMVQDEKWKNRLLNIRTRLLIAGGLLLLLSLFFHRFFNPDLYNAILFIYQPIASSLLLPFFIYQPFRPNYFTRLFTHLSLTGYAILLSHLYCLQFLFIKFFPAHSLKTALFTTMLYLLALLLFSAFFYNRVERPILLLRKK